MKRLLAALLIAALAASAAFVLDGQGSFGRLALRAGLPALAAGLLEDPHWQGAALYRAGRYEAAVEAFRAAGSAGFYDRGNALARSERYSEAVEFYDAQLFRLPHDEAAQANRVLVAGLIDKVQARSEASPGLAAAGSGQEDNEGQDEENPITAVQPTPSIKIPWAQEQVQVRKSFEGQSIMANRQWLATLADEPGRYLKLRIAAEQARRQQLGIAMPQDDNPW